MNQYTAVAIIFTTLFISIAANNYYTRKSEMACFSVADTPAKLAICKGASYKEQQ